MEFSEQVIVLHVGKFKEADIWVRLLSPTQGIISAFAFGGSRSRRRFIGCLDTFNHVLFRIQKNSRTGLYILQEGVLLQGPLRLRSDWQRLGLATNCSRFLQSFGLAPDGAGKAASLFTDLLHILETAEEISPLLPLFFRLRLAYEQGYALNVHTCHQCGASLEQAQSYFYVRAGIFLCASCAAFGGERTIALQKGSLCAIQHVVAFPLSTWETLHVTARERYECARAIDSFIQYHVGLIWENGRFIRS